MSNEIPLIATKDNRSNNTNRDKTTKPQTQTQTQPQPRPHPRPRRENFPHVFNDNQTFAKLEEGNGLCHYIRTLKITLGRKSGQPGQVDIPLGNTKSVSRQHAQMNYNLETKMFEMTVFGKNGVLVNDSFIDKNSTVPLKNG
ncbi:hypothetical protein J3Q64DRAFT_1751112 [Phycomyces blakesleeanus]|uniref:FHA domain-containing protein n=1 Tax=Phycomyces blakesleeanus TaxID=4837 RepID=A0ABR3AW00_PHYBL